MLGQAEREKLLALPQYHCLATPQSPDIEEESNIKRSVIRGPVVVCVCVGGGYTPIHPDNLPEKDSGAVLFLKTTKIIIEISVFIQLSSNT